MGEMQQILAGINAIASDTKAVNGKVDKLVGWQVKMDERCDHHRRDTDGVRQVLYGDKEDGLVFDVQRLKNCKDTLKRSAAVWRGLVFMVLGTLISTGIILVIVWLMGLYRDSGLV